jgi:hypothetical protein
VNDVARLYDRLLAYWDGDGWINTPDQFDTALRQYGQLMKTPSNVEIGKEAEKH